MTSTASRAGTHPRHNAARVREMLDHLARLADDTNRQVANGVLRFATTAELDACRDSAAQLADALLGLARHLEREGDT